MTDALWLATLDTRNFTFEGVGATETEALDVLLHGLREHARQYRLPPDWYGDELPLPRLLERGNAYRDGVVL